MKFSDSHAKQRISTSFLPGVEECVRYLGPNGISGVQISPVTEHILGTQWYTKYQPIGTDGSKMHLRVELGAIRWFVLRSMKAFIRSNLSGM